MKSINAQIRIAVDNTNKLMLGEFDFTPSQILNKTFIFDTLKIDEENIIGRIIDTLKNKITMNIMQRKKTYQRPDEKVEEDVVFLRHVPVHPRDRLTRNVRNQFNDLETVDYNNDTNVSDLGTKKKSGKQIAAKEIFRKY